MWVLLYFLVLLSRNSATDLVKQELLFVGQEGGKLLAVRNLVQKGFTPPVLIFVQSIERAKELFHELIYDGLNVDVIHSDRTQAQRDNVVKSFRAGKVISIHVCVGGGGGRGGGDVLGGGEGVVMCCGSPCIGLEGCGAISGGRRGWREDDIKQGSHTPKLNGYPHIKLHHAFNP